MTIAKLSNLLFDKAPLGAAFQQRNFEKTVRQYLGDGSIHFEENVANSNTDFDDGEIFTFYKDGKESLTLYNVAKGDTVSGIIEKYNASISEGEPKLTLEMLKQLNPHLDLSNPKKLNHSDFLRLPYPQLKCMEDDESPRIVVNSYDGHCYLGRTKYADEAKN